MSTLFNYQTIKVSAIPKYKSIKVELHRPECNNAVNNEMIFELESFLTWATSHLEIDSILFTSSSDLFSQGHDIIDSDFFSNEKLNSLLLRLQKIIYSMYFLPQTVVMDIQAGASGIGAELTLGGDIRLAKKSATISFNHASEGLVPTCGGVGILGAIIPKSYARSWLLSSKKVNAEEMLNSGLILEYYEDGDRDEVILKTLRKMCPIPILQLSKMVMSQLFLYMRT